MPTPKQMEKLAAEAARRPANAAAALEAPLPAEYWDSVLKDPQAVSGGSRHRRLSEIQRHVMRVSCRRCERTVEIQTVDAVRLYGGKAVWKDVAQRLVNAYVKTLKFMHSHTAAEIADKMPTDYFAGDKTSYIADLQSQLGIFGTDCRMPAGGPETVQKIQQQFVSSYKGQSANLSETYTNTFADKAS